LRSSIRTSRTNLNAMAKHTLLLILLSTLIGCSSEPNPDSRQAGLEGSPPVFRSVLDGRARMITLHLGDSLWVAYSAQTGGFYRAWRDGVDLDGAVYTTVHGPQPESIGPAYLEANERETWHLIENGRRTTLEVRYLGHEFTDGGVELSTEIRGPDGQWIVVRELPSQVVDDEGHEGLKRTFITENVPDGVEVGLDVQLASLAGPESYSTDGRLEANSPDVRMVAAQAGGTGHGGEQAAAEAFLTLNSNGSTTFTTYFGEPLLAPETSGDDASKPEGLALIERSDCAACHNPTEQTIGPSYQAIAERYEPTAPTVARLAAKVISGGSGEWGDAVMSPHPGLPAEDARTMVEYILSLGAAPAQTAEGDLMNVAGEAYRFTDEYDGAEGLAVNMYALTEDPRKLDELRMTESPFLSVVVPAIHVPDESYLGEVRQNVYVEATGFLTVAAADNYVIRLVSDDGSRVFLDGELLIDNDGLHGTEARDAELILEEGTYPIRVEFFQGGGGGSLSLQWARSADSGFSVIPPSALSYDEGDLKEAVDYATALG